MGLFNKKRKDEKSITISQNGMKIRGAIHAEEFLSWMFTGLLNYMRTLVKEVDKKNRRAVMDSLYDSVNTLCGRILDIFDPERGRWHDDLTEEIMAKAEALVIQEKYLAMPEEERAANTEALHKWMKEYANAHNIPTSTKPAGTLKVIKGGRDEEKGDE